MNKNRQFLNSLWPFCMIKINLSLKNWSFSMQCQLTSNDAKIQSHHVHKKQSKRCKKRRNSMAQPELGFLLGPITTFFLEESVVGEQPSTTNRIASRGSPHDPTMRTVLVIQRRGACTQSAHLVPSRRPDLRVVAWREGMIRRLTLGARVRRNPAGFRAGQWVFQGFD